MAGQIISIGLNVGKPWSNETRGKELRIADGVSGRMRRGWHALELPRKSNKDPRTSQRELVSCETDCIGREQHQIRIREKADDMTHVCFSVADHSS